MNRRDFLKRGILLGGAAAVTTASPALADHVIEPQNPITGLKLYAYRYSDPRNTQISEDGTSKITFDQIRVEPVVMATHPDGSPLNGDPSEHFKMSLKARHAKSVVLDEEGNLIGLNHYQEMWGLTWNHSNIGPHGGLQAPQGQPKVGWEASQGSHYTLGLLGWHVLFCAVTGMESGNTFSKTLWFERIAG